MSITHWRMYILSGCAVWCSVVSLAHAGPPQALASPPGNGAPSPKEVAQRCSGHASGQRVWYPQGPELTGMLHVEGHHSRQLVVGAVDLAGAERPGYMVDALQVAAGRLQAMQTPVGIGAPPVGPEWNLSGVLLHGRATDGRPVTLAICAAEADVNHGEQVWYRIERFNPATRAWENPCLKTMRIEEPRALAMDQVWDERGMPHHKPGQFSFACETGVIAKCVTMGYRPWQTQPDGQSLAAYHQACTRMARADYCGNGQSHTREANSIDIYDRKNLLTPSPDPGLGTFEAGWTPQGAYCLAHTRDGRALERIQTECPGQWQMTAEEVGAGERCLMRRKGMKPADVILRNRSAGGADGADATGAQ